MATALCRRGAVRAAGGLANDAVLREDGGEWTVQGDPTEAAFLVAEAKLGATEARRARFERVGEVPFTSERKLMSTRGRRREGGPHRRRDEGRPDVLLARCTHERVAGEVRRLTDTRRAEIAADVERLADLALRTLAVAYRPLPDVELPPGSADEAHERGRRSNAELVYLGMVGIIDPPGLRRGWHRRGTERRGADPDDHRGPSPHRCASRPSSASAPTARALTGAEIDGLDEEALTRAVRDVSVFARVAPEHKLRIVDALQDDGNIVAMTGTG